MATRRGHSHNRASGTLDVCIWVFPLGSDLVQGASLLHATRPHGAVYTRAELIEATSHDQRPSPCQWYLDRDNE